MSLPDSPRLSARQGWLLTLGVALLAGLLAAHGFGEVRDIVVQARYRALAVIAVHLPVTLMATIGWQVLLPRGTRPPLGFLFRLRLIKEAINGLLPVAQVGGDVVRARLAVRPGLTLAQTTASCILDVLAGTLGLVVFVLAGLVLALLALHDPRFARLSLVLIAAIALTGLAIVLWRRLGLLDRLSALAGRWRAWRDRFSHLGEALGDLSRQRGDLVASWLWHLAAWICGALETYVAVWAIGLHPTLTQALILESLTQAVKGLGFAIPGSLGIQEGGYILLGGALGVTPDQALALSLLRRVRELMLGVLGLVLWRTTRPHRADLEHRQPGAGA
ncbi:flippase-like domain-containing protein [Caulobacter sp. LARHSG274]